MPWRGWESPWKIIRDFESLLLPSIYKVSEARELVLHPQPIHDSLSAHGGTRGHLDVRLLMAPWELQPLGEAGAGLRERFQTPTMAKSRAVRRSCWRDPTSSGLVPITGHTSHGHPRCWGNASPCSLRKDHSDHLLLDQGCPWGARRRAGSCQPSGGQLSCSLPAQPASLQAASSRATATCPRLRCL